MTIATQQAAPTTATQLRSGDPIEPGTMGAVTERVVIDADGGGTAPITDSGEMITDSTTATPTATVTDGGTSLELVDVHADAEGDDGDNLNDEYVVFENTGSSSVDISGLELADVADHIYTFPDRTVLDPGD